MCRGIGALFRHIEQSIEFEIDCQDEIDASFSWRNDVRAVFLEPGDTEELPRADCRDIAEWQILIQALSDRILWDEDFMDASLYVDQPPEQAQFLKDAMTIEDDYFTAVPPDPRETDLPRIRAVIAELVGL